MLPLHASIITDECSPYLQFSGSITVKPLSSPMASDLLSALGRRSLNKGERRQYRQYRH
jgi:hypothetical protein